MDVGLAEVNGTNLYYEIIGEGHPIVLIGGGGSLDRRMWEEQITVFSEQYQAICYDPRGIGKSEIPDDSFSHSRDLYSLLKFLNVEKAYILGLSLGGTIAIDFTLEYPEMVKALILVASGLSDLKEEVLEATSALSRIAKEEGVARVVQMIVEDDSYIAPENLAARQRAREILAENAHIFHSEFSSIRFWQPVEPPASQRLSEICVPTLIVVGERDYPGIHAIADILETSIAGARKAVISGAGHMANLEKPEKFNQVVSDFLSHQ